MNILALKKWRYKGTQLVFNTICLVRGKIITFGVGLIYIPTRDLQLNKSCGVDELNETLSQRGRLWTNILDDLDLDTFSTDEHKQSSLENEDAMLWHQVVYNICLLIHTVVNFNCCW